MQLYTLTSGTQGSSCAADYEIKSSSARHKVLHFWMTKNIPSNTLKAQYKPPSCTVNCFHNEEKFELDDITLKMKYIATIQENIQYYYFYPFADSLSWNSWDLNRCDGWVLLQLQINSKKNHEFPLAIFHRTTYSYQEISKAYLLYWIWKSKKREPTSSKAIIICCLHILILSLANNLSH